MSGKREAVHVRRTKGNMVIDRAGGVCTIINIVIGMLATTSVVVLVPWALGINEWWCYVLTIPVAFFVIGHLELRFVSPLVSAIVWRAYGIGTKWSVDKYGNAVEVEPSDPRLK